MNGRVLASVRGFKGLLLVLTTTKSFTTWRRALPLFGRFSVVVSATLDREEDKVQRPLYYASRALRGVEERYPSMEKLAFPLVMVALKLKPYF